MSRLDLPHILAHSFAMALVTLVTLAFGGCDLDGKDELEQTIDRHAEPPDTEPPTPDPELVASATIPSRRPWPPTDLPLALLATLEARDATDSRATIRDDDSGVIASYRPGDRIRDAVKVLAIEEGVVELSNEGEVQYLSVSAIPVELSADDMFYPDLVDDLRLSGSMEDAVELPPGIEYSIKAGIYAWGTRRTIALLRDAIRTYARGRDAPKVHIGDISRRHGGPFAPHISHQQGRDVDIAYVLKNRQRFAIANNLSLDRARTWALIGALLDTQAIVYIFVDYDIQRLLYEHALAEGVDESELDRVFQYPHGRRAAHGVLRHWKGHRDHFHVRFEP